MKKDNKIKILIFCLLLFVSQQLMSQPPNPPGDATNGGNDIGGGAPIGSGLGILLALGTAYGGKKAFKLLKDKDVLEE